MVEIGRVNRLRVVKHVHFGVYLDGEELGEILLPSRYVPQDCHIDDIVEVFIFLDSEDRFLATTQMPYATVGQFAFLQVVSATSIGAFLEWGLSKDLFVPVVEQQQRMKEGRSYLVYIYFDAYSQRLAASSKLEKFLDREPFEGREGQQVDLVIAHQTDLGYTAIINHAHRGMLFKNEVYQELSKGQQLQGFIKRLRPDGKIDLSLQKPGYAKVPGASQKILDVLRQHGGSLAVTDKTSPERIYALFEMSKKTYKKAIGALYKQRKVVIENDGITLLQQKSQTKRRR